MAEKEFEEIPIEPKDVASAGNGCEWVRQALCRFGSTWKRGEHYGVRKLMDEGLGRLFEDLLMATQRYRAFLEVAPNSTGVVSVCAEPDHPPHVVGALWGVAKKEGKA